LLGVPFFRPPRRSPGLDPRMATSLLFWRPFCSAWATNFLPTRQQVDFLSLLEKLQLRY
jgi:hypothetical protein